VVGPRIGSVTYRVLTSSRTFVLAVPPNLDAPVHPGNASPRKAGIRTIVPGAIATPESRHRQRQRASGDWFGRNIGARHPGRNPGLASFSVRSSPSCSCRRLSPAAR